MKSRVGFANEHPRQDTVDWYTPPEIFTALGLSFDLDPCAPAGGLPWIPAAKFYSNDDDGLIQPWAGRVWLNPPYGRYTPNWLRKLARHGDGIALVYSRTETAWFQDAASRAGLVCFKRGRISFIDEKGQVRDGTRAGSVLLAYGDQCVHALARANLGACFYGGGLR